MFAYIQYGTRKLFICDPLNTERSVIAVESWL